MRVGILTSGGDCQALNATMRGLVKALYQQRKDIEIIGFLKGQREEPKIVPPTFKISSKSLKDIFLYFSYINP